MTVDSINVESTLANVRALLERDQSLSPAVRSTLEVLLLLVNALVNRLGLNSKNSSKPPSSDTNRKKRTSRRSNRNPGGQPGHAGKTLEPFAEPDETVVLRCNRAQLPAGEYRHAGFDKRQVLDIDITTRVTEYQGEVLENAEGVRFTARFPDGVSRPIQYGNAIKAHAIYLSQYQLLPYKRIGEYFADQFGVPMSAGSIVNFNRNAAERLEPFMPWVKQQLIREPVLHVDETSININAGKYWLHVASSTQLTCFDVHTARGKLAMDAMGILPHYEGIACHDHWKPYYRFACQHALCNAHHLRELERAGEQDGQRWALNMRKLLLEINAAVDKAGGVLDSTAAKRFRKRYRSVLTAGEHQCPPPDPGERRGRRGRLPRSKARNLLERLRAFEDDALRFMTTRDVPFTNNNGERDIRMTKLQQKISGCFRSIDGARNFCTIRSYLSTCRKNQVTASEALAKLLQGDWPDFISLP